MSRCEPRPRARAAGDQPLEQRQVRARGHLQGRLQGGASARPRARGSACMRLPARARARVRQGFAVAVHSGVRVCARTRLVGLLTEVCAYVRVEKSLQVGVFTPCQRACVRGVGRGWGAESGWGNRTSFRLPSVCACCPCLAVRIPFSLFLHATWFLPVPLPSLHMRA